MIRFSVIIPVRNGAASLDACLQAVCRQDYPDFEVIVVDDASTDSTRAVAARYPVRIAPLSTPQGAARARNVGARVAEGDVLFFTDADVLLPPNALSLVAERLADPAVSGVVGLLSEHIRTRDLGSQFKNLWMHYTYRRQPLLVGLFLTSAAALRREVFAAAGGFDEHYRGASVGEDIEFGQRLRTRGERIILEQRLTVEHLKRYSLGDVLHTDYRRARSLTLTFLRNHLGGRSRHYASVPTSFGLSLLPAAALALALLALPWRPGVAAMAAALSYGLVLALNAHLLAFLLRRRGLLFGVQSALFLPCDLWASGLGVVRALVDYVRGVRY